MRAGGNDSSSHYYGWEFPFKFLFIFQKCKTLSKGGGCTPVAWNRNPNRSYKAWKITIIWWKKKKSWQAVKFRKGRRGEGGQKLVESLALAEVKFSKKAGSPRAFRGHGVNRVLRGLGGWSGLSKGELMGAELRSLLVFNFCSQEELSRKTAWQLRGRKLRNV